MENNRHAEYQEKKLRLSEQIARTGNVRLGKKTSNLFRNRNAARASYLDVRDFTSILEVNVAEGWVEVEGMATYVDVVDATLPHGVVPAVVPELKSITVGGAVSGTGLESSSFRYGFVHETVLEMDVLLADGTVVTCTPTNEHSDLFFGMANSYGTFGYILRLKVKTVPTKQFVHLQHVTFTAAPAYFSAMQAYAADPTVGFIDGAVHGKHQYVLTIGRFCDAAPYTSDYTYKNIYYKSQQSRTEDYLDTKAYLWRLDTDWFWCSNVIGAQNPIIRRLLGKKRLNSMFYTSVMRWDYRWGFSARFFPLIGVREEWLIQDSEIPIEKAVEYLDFFHTEISEKPIAVAPVRVPAAQGNPTGENRFPLFPLKPNTWYANIGFYNSVPTTEERGAGYFNKLVEKKTRELSGIKMLYSDAYYTEDEFWAIYDKTAYTVLKEKYDPQHKLKGLFEKCVRKQ